jgi:hypothetical protein
MMNKKRIIKSLEEAYEFALPYVLSAGQTDISDRVKFRESWSLSLPQTERSPDMKEYVTELFHDHADPVPRNAVSRRWQITPETLRNTLSYIYEKMAHRCYMLCIDDSGVQFCKLQQFGLSESFDKAVHEQLENMEYNKLITEKHRKHIRRVAEQPMRVMQCILKNQTVDDEDTKDIKDDEEGATNENVNEYMVLLQNLVLPHGVFILNLTDAVMLHRDNREPFPMVTGDLPIEWQYQHRFHLPIFSISGQQRYSDIPIPNYDDMFIILGMKDMKFDEFIVDWDQKTNNKAVFRGGPSGCGYTTETNQRLHLVSMKSPLLDAKIVGKGKTIDSQSVKFDPVHGLGMLNTGMKPGNFVSMVEQSKHKYIIHVDGNVHAYRLLTTMMTGSLVIRVESPYISWVDHLIKPGQHYVLVKPDLSDLIEKIRWCEAHPKSARKMARAGYEFARRALTREYVEKTVEKIFWSLPHMSRFSRIHTRKNWKVQPRSPEGPAPRTPEEYIPIPLRKPTNAFMSAFSPRSPNAFSPRSPDETNAFSPRSPNAFSPRSPDEINAFSPRSPDEINAFSPQSPIETNAFLSMSPNEAIAFTPGGSPDYNYKGPMTPEGSPDYNYKGPMTPTPFWLKPGYVPKSPDTTPPRLKTSSPSLKEDDIIEFPPGAKKCPNGYNVITIKGKKMCKRVKNKTRKNTQQKE